ncbi:MAG: FAD-dependent oxidoreductase [Pseudohongiella nitratireducens]|nr:FAD-dependent oxidoreductase [Pseudohongiella nitratireducens]
MVSRNKPVILIVGFGMAAGRLLEEIIDKADNAFEIIVVGEEPQAAYNRILLSPLLAGEIPSDNLALHDSAWYETNGIRVITGDPVISLDTNRKRATTASGERLAWDYLVLATGSRPGKLKLPGESLKGVQALRNMADAERLLGSISSIKKAVVIGGGLLGLEAACALQAHNIDTTVVHNASWPMNRQLDSEAGERLVTALHEKGVTFVADAQCERYLEDEQGAVAGLALADDQVFPCELVVEAVGVVPEITLAKAAGIPCERAIVVDDKLRTQVDDVFAIGECCQIEEELFGLVTPIYQQAAVLANVFAVYANTESEARRLLLLADCQGYVTQALPTKLKVSGVHVFSAGTLVESENNTIDDKSSPVSMAMRDDQGGYRRLWWQDNRLIGAVMFGDTEDSQCYVDMIAEQKNVAPQMQVLLDPAGLEEELSPEQEVSS